MKGCECGNPQIHAFDGRTASTLSRQEYEKVVECYVGAIAQHTNVDRFYALHEFATNNQYKGERVCFWLWLPSTAQVNVHLAEYRVVPQSEKLFSKAVKWELQKDTQRDMIFFFLVDGKQQFHSTVMIKRMEQNK
jgi:hypothetical protein